MSAGDAAIQAIAERLDPVALSHACHCSYHLARAGLAWEEARRILLDEPTCCPQPPTVAE